MSIGVELPSLRVNASTAANHMRAELLLRKLEDEADLEFERKWKSDQKKIVQRNVRKPETKSQQCRKQLSRLRVETADIEK